MKYYVLGRHMIDKSEVCTAYFCPCSIWRLEICDINSKGITEIVNIFPAVPRQF